MDKISKSQVLEVLGNVAPALRKLASERDAAVEELRLFRQQAEAEKVAAALIQKGHVHEPYERVVTQMMKAAETGQLDSIKLAIEYMGPDMGEKIAHVAEDEHVSASATATEFERYILGSIG